MRKLSGLSLEWEIAEKLGGYFLLRGVALEEFIPRCGHLL